MVGSMLRAGVVELLPQHVGQWPWATFIVNAAGCLILGYAIAHLGPREGSQQRVALIGTGFCGALTTFSTFQLELYDMLDADKYALAIAYFAASLALGLAAVNLAKRAVQ